MNEATKPAPWWRFRMVWLVIAGPALVVLASVATLCLALAHGDPVISEPQLRPDYAAPRAEAMKARNHAATPRP